MGRLSRAYVPKAPEQGVLYQIALIEDRSVIRRILRHLGLPTERPAARPARPPPLPIGRPDTWYDEDIPAP